MTDANETRRLAFLDLGATHYGTPRFITTFAEDTGLTRQAVQMWSDGKRPVPEWALLLLSAWLDVKRGDQMRQHMRALAQLID